ncbi:MAG: hypothetical protein PHT99_01220 [Methanoregula sp.]|nr:hypothetical protein [Methanoregula sp.]
MRAGGCTFFVIVLILIAVITAGCSSLPFFGPGATPEKINIGFSSTTRVPEHETYSFESVTKRLADVVFDEDNNIPANTTTDRQILYFRGMQMDNAGNADNWMFIVRHGDTVSIVAYDKYGETITGWNTSYQAQAIPMDRILSPVELFNRNQAIIFVPQQDTSPGPTELELQRTNYTLTISGKDKTRILIFDATTGVLTFSNE